MNAPLWVHDLAAAFWCQAGVVEPFPRQLRGAIRRAFPVNIVDLGDLSVARIQHWLAVRGIGAPLNLPDRPLYGCMIAHDDGGLFFIETHDSAEQKRFTLAHELAHFLRDYWQPRRQAVGVLGHGVQEVFDGKRLPSTEEVFHAQLRRVPLGVHTHLMQRPRPGQVSPRVGHAEQEADRLACELLAPAQHILAGRPELSPEQRARVRHQLVTDYGLPAEVAATYLEQLAPSPRQGEPWLAALRQICNEPSNSTRRPGTGEWRD